METHIHIIQDKKTKYFFGFIANRPSICAQGDSIPEVKNKIDKYKKYPKKKE